MFPRTRSIAFSLSCLSFLCAACFRHPMEGNGDAQIEERPLPSFTRIESHLSAPVTVRQGQTFWVQVIADSNIAPLIELSVRDGTLVIGSRSDFVQATPVRVEIILPVLESVKQLGSGPLEVAGLEGHHDLDLSQTGSGRLRLSGDVGALAVRATGSGSVVLVGHAAQLNAGLLGSGSVDGAGLAVESGATLAVLGSGQLWANVRGDATLHTQGSGSIEAALNDGTANFGIEGSGAIRWSGNARVGAATISGPGRLEHS